MSNDITMTVNKADIERLRTTLQSIVANTRKKMPDLLKQAFVFAVQSATKATHPGTASRPSKLAKRYRIRPIIKGLTQFGGFYFYRYIDRSGNPQAFRSDRLITRTVTKSGKPRKSGLLQLVTTGVKYWSKRIHGWDAMPITGAARSIATERKLRIPHYGAAKAGFILMLRALGKPAETDGENGRLATVLKNFGDTAWIKGTNEVSYAVKTSPQAASEGIRKAANRMDAIWLKQLGKDVMPSGAKA